MQAGWVSSDEERQRRTDLQVASNFRVTESVRVPNKHKKPAAKAEWYRVGRGLIYESAQMPDTKEDQELLVVKAFALQTRDTLGISEILPLAAGHDFSASVRGRKIEIQLTEIADFNVAKKAPDPHVKLTWAGREHPSFDPVSLNQCLAAVIAKKIEKNYAEQLTPLWLLVWSAIALGNHDASWSPLTPFNTARQMLRNSAGQPFEQIWYTNPIHGLVEQVWPITIG